MLTLQKSLQLGSSLSTDRSVHYFFFEKTSSSVQQIAIDEPLGQASSSVRVADPDGDILHWSVMPVSQQRFTVAGSIPITSSSVRHTIDLPEKTGIYKIAIKGIDASTFDILADFTIDAYGIWNPGGHINQNSIDFSPGYIFVPAENSDYGFIATGDVTVRRSDLTVIPETENSSGGIDMALNPTRGADDVWSIDTSGTWSLRHQGQPFCVCNSIAAANAIQSGTVDVGGIRFWSKGDQLGYQRVQDLISGIEKVPSIGNAIKTWDLAVTEWAKNPARYHEVREYANAFRTIHTAINQQVTESPEYMTGMIVEEIGGAVPDLLPRGDDAIQRGGFFGFLAGWDDPTNPYFDDPDMKTRARISMHSEFRHVQGHRVQRGRTDVSDRLGNAGLAATSELGFALYFNNEIGNIETVDAEALMPNLADQLDSLFASSYTSTRNQDCGVLPLYVMAPLIWQMVYGNDNLKALCLHEADGIVNPDPALPGTSGTAGVPLPEAVSYDGSYSGIQNYGMGAAWICSNKASEWEFIKEASQRNYEWYAHFCSPTKDTFAGVYAHDSDSRTSLGAIQEQYGGAHDMLSDEVPVVARFTAMRGLFVNSRSDPEGLTAYANQMNGEIIGGSNFQTLWEIHTGWKFQIISLWNQTYEKLTNPNAYTLPCEVETEQVEIVEEKDRITINAPSYFASLPIYFPGEFYWRYALEQYRNPRPFDSVGGAWLDEPFPMTTVKDRRGVDCEEIGGSGISMLYSKKTKRPVITGRNILPTTTHQIIGITSGGERRWGRPSDRTYEVDGNSIIISYSMYGDDNFVQGDFDIVKTLTFLPNAVRVSNEVTRMLKDIDTIELYETIPMCCKAELIGNQSRNQLIQAISNPRPEINRLGDDIILRGELLPTSFIEFTSNSESFTYARVPVAIPSEQGQSLTTAYTIQLPFDPPEDVDFEEIGASISPTIPRRRRRGAVIKDSPLFFKVNNRTFSLQNSGNTRVNNQIPIFDRRASIELSYLLDDGSFSEIRYTINGSEPTKKSSLYSNPIVIDKAIAGNDVVSVKAKVFEKDSITSGKLIEFRFKIR
jgi:hypothetical protein